MLHCIITVRDSSNTCGKIFLRQPLRSQLAQEAACKTVEALLAEKGRNLMKPGDPEPPHLPKGAVLSRCQERTCHSTTFR